MLIGGVNSLTTLAFTMKPNETVSTSQSMKSDW